ncbi:MAG TPA: NrfD/PsrC family molybdoenzyme membrane anchor subunit [Vicinamibacterales bacterium]|nr:NrfD/PsrC family molybdoenzyme membrane anchor subunit [Vicinamibacterales bacterium]
MKPDASLIPRGTDLELTDRLLRPVMNRSLLWLPLFGLASLGTLMLVLAVAYTFVSGPGVWGNQIPVAWAYPIVNFVWWIGLGHAGTFISAFLLLLHQHWRSSINRIAEAMTLFALVNAGMFPLLHLGRPWFFYWLIPYPATMGVWPEFKSTLPWDAAAVTTYFTVSLLFWYLGLVPDLAAARDRARTPLARVVYGLFAFGWRGTVEQWAHYRIAYLLLAGLAAPLVVSVHSIVSLDFAIALVPGWHSTIFPPYFVVGAIYSGFALVFVLVVPIREIFGLDDVITDTHLDRLAQITLTTAWMLVYSYTCETFIAWYTGDRFEQYTYLFARPLGPYALVYWSMTFFNLVVPQIFWWRRMRRSGIACFLAGLLILVGMWEERFVIIVTSLNRDFLPSSWAFYMPTLVDWAILLGSISLFWLLFLAFMRFVPSIAIHEVKRDRMEELVAVSGSGE